MISLEFTEDEAELLAIFYRIGMGQMLMQTMLNNGQRDAMKNQMRDVVPFMIAVQEAPAELVSTLFMKMDALSRSLGMNDDTQPN